MAKLIKTQADIGVLGYRDNVSLASARSSGTADSVGTPGTGANYGGGWKWDNVPANGYFRTETVITFDLSALPLDAIITSGTIAITTSSTGYKHASWAGSQYFRFVGTQDGSATVETTDMRPFTDAASALTDDILYSATNPTVNLTSVGLQHIQNWLASDQAVEFSLQSVAGQDGYDPGSPTVVELNTPYYTAATLTLQYEQPGIMLGCNF